MVLKIGEETISSFVSTQKLLDAHSDLNKRSEDFCKSPVKKVGKREKCVYIYQREMGIVRSNDEKIELMGSEDATTCHIVVIKERQYGTWGLAHIDSHENNQVEELVTALQHDTSCQGGQEDDLLQLDISLIGGYDDETRTSAKITKLVIDYMIAQQTVVFNLNILCVGTLNTRIVEGDSIYPAPIHYGTAVNVKTGHISPAKFDCHGPDTDIRMLQKKLLTQVYSSVKGKFVIPAFEYEAAPSAHLWLQIDDDFILTHLSTSPKVEPPEFCENMRAMFRRMISDPRPLDSIFKNNCDRVYSLNERSGEWKLENEEQFTSESRSRRDHTTFSVRDFVTTAKKL